MGINLLIKYNSCSTIPVEVFYRIQETGNLRLLGIGTPQTLKDVWTNIISEYIELIDSTKTKESVRTRAGMVKMKNKLNTLLAGLLLINIGYIDDGYKVLDHFNIKNFKDGTNEYNKLKTKLGIKINKIKIDSNDIPKLNIYSDLVNVEQILERTIDIKTINVKYWVELNLMAKAIIKQKEKAV